MVRYLLCRLSGQGRSLLAVGYPNGHAGHREIRVNEGSSRAKQHPDARRVAIVGGGISGVAAAHRLAESVDVTLFEAERRLGGHTDSHSVWVEDKVYTIDTGFVAFHPSGHAGFCEWLTQIGVPSQRTDDV